MNKRRVFLKSMLALGSLPLLSTTIATAQEASPQEIFNDPHAPVLGNPDGDVTVVEYFDYQCGYCKRDFSMVRDVIATDSNVKLVMKDWPIFGEVSVYAAQATLAAATLGKYDVALTTLMSSKGRLSYEKVDGDLTAAGLDMDELASAVRANKAKIDGVLNRSYQQAVSLGLRGTPAFVIGKTVYGGVIDKSTLLEAIATARG